MYLPGSFLAQRVAAERRQDMLREVELDRLLQETRALRRSRLACRAGGLLRRLGCHLMALGTRLGQGATCSETSVSCAR